MIGSVPSFGEGLTRARAGARPLSPDVSHQEVPLLPLATLSNLILSVIPTIAIVATGKLRRVAYRQGSSQQGGVERVDNIHAYTNPVKWVQPARSLLPR